MSLAINNEPQKRCTWCASILAPEADAVCPECEVFEEQDLPFGLADLDRLAGVEAFAQIGGRRD